MAGKLILYEFSCSIQIFFFFWFWREIVFGVTYVLSVQYSCAVVSFLLLWRESYLVYNVQFSCAVVSVFWFMAGNRFWCYLLTYFKYNRVVALC